MSIQIKEAIRMIESCEAFATLLDRTKLSFVADGRVDATWPKRMAAQLRATTVLLDELVLALGAKR